MLGSKLVQHMNPRWILKSSVIIKQVTDKLQLGLDREMKMLDPTGVGFAFGGVYPGTLHAKGKTVETHKVSYSVGRVGTYLLHVRLRQQAVPLNGSPFSLKVSIPP